MEQRYIISDAAKKIDVEAHVLRYWEEELELQIPRNELGHRYYREQDLNLLSEIKELKEKGIQLKAIKSIIPKLNDNGEGNEHLNQLFLVEENQEMKAKKEKSLEQASEEMLDLQEAEHKNQKVDEPLDVREHSLIMQEEALLEEKTKDEKMHQFELILKGIVNEALMENNAELGQQVSSKVTDSVIKEMDYLMRMQDEREEERYKKIDEMIRHYQKRRREVASTKEGDKKKKKEGLFRKKNKVSMEPY